MTLRDEPRGKTVAVTIAHALQARLTAAGRLIALLGVILVLLMIGGLKFTQIEIDGLKPLISGTPWLAWMYPVFGEAGASYLLGVVEIATALLLCASPWSARAGVAGWLRPTRSPARVVLSSIVIASKTRSKLRSKAAKFMRPITSI